MTSRLSYLFIFFNIGCAERYASSLVTIMNRNRFYILCVVILIFCLGGIVAGALMVEKGCKYQPTFSADCMTTSFEFDVSHWILTIYLGYTCENSFNASMPVHTYTSEQKCPYPKSALSCLQDNKDRFLPLGTHWTGYSHTEGCCYEPQQPKDPVDPGLCGGGIAFLCVFISLGVMTLFILLTADSIHQCCCLCDIEDRRDLLEERPQA